MRLEIYGNRGKCNSAQDKNELTSLRSFVILADNDGTIVVAEISFKVVRR